MTILSYKTMFHSVPASAGPTTYIWALSRIQNLIIISRGTSFDRIHSRSINNKIYFILGNNSIHKYNNQIIPVELDHHLYFWLTRDIRTKDLIKVTVVSMVMVAAGFHLILSNGPLLIHPFHLNSQQAGQVLETYHYTLLAMALAISPLVVQQVVPTQL